jgi:hypothetical protein
MIALAPKRDMGRQFADLATVIMRKDSLDSSSENPTFAGFGVKKWTI